MQQRSTMDTQEVRTEEYQIDGDELLAKVKELVREGNIRRVSIKNTEGRTLIEIPLTWGVVGVLLKPSLVALGALAALATNYTIVVEKVAEASEH
jgi:hypothetical protein